MKAILVAVNTKDDKYDIDYSLNELEQLAMAGGFEVVSSFYQKLVKPNPKTYIGIGKISEIQLVVIGYNIDVVIFNDELSPSQLRNLEEALQVPCIDRSYLILQIFESRAQSRQAALEIKLAKKLYLLPRIGLLKNQESKNVGASGAVSSKGSGETQRELERRHIVAEINHLRKELQQIKQMKTQQIAKRKKNAIPIVALVGYTNAGKSSTLNTILKYTEKEEKSVFVKDQLFATLATSNRRINYENNEFIMVDTIGFVSKLPHQVIESFFQTLAEIKEADYIIHVVDSSSPYLNEQISVVKDVLRMLEADTIPSILLLNKWDKALAENSNVYGSSWLPFSNLTKLNVDKLLEQILSNIGPSTVRAKLLLPYSLGKLSHILETQSHIYRKDYLDEGIYYDVELPIKQYKIFKDYDLENLVN